MACNVYYCHTNVRLDRMLHLSLELNSLPDELSNARNDEDCTNVSDLDSFVTHFHKDGDEKKPVVIDRWSDMHQVSYCKWVVPYNQQDLHLD